MVFYGRKPFHLEALRALKYAQCATRPLHASLLPYSVCTMRNIRLSRITFAILSMHHAQRPPFAHHFCHTQYAPCATSAFRASLLPYSVCTVRTSRLSSITFAILSMDYAQHPPFAHRMCNMSCWERIATGSELRCSSKRRLTDNIIFPYFQHLNH